MELIDWFKEYGLAGLMLFIGAGMMWKCGRFLGPLATRMVDAHIDTLKGIEQSMQTLAKSSERHAVSDEKQTDILQTIAKDHGQMIHEIHGKVVKDKQ